MGPSLSYLLQVFESKAVQYRQMMMGEQAATATQLAVAHEEIHWLLLISGHFLADNFENETVMLPDAVRCFADQVRKQVTRRIMRCHKTDQPLFFAGSAGG